MKLELTQEEINVLLNLISEKPLGEVIDLFNKIRSQALEQLDAKGQDSE